MNQVIRQGPRSGNAMLTAVMVMSLAAVFVATSMQSSVANQHLALVTMHDSEALAALEVVLGRRQRMVMDMAANAQPETFTVTHDNYGRLLPTPETPVNYGVDFVGRCEVRWKVEPVYAKAYDGVDPDGTVIENPMPDGGTGRPANAVDNSTGFFLYRIAAESRINTQVAHDGEDASVDSVRLETVGQDVLARAHGVRFVTTVNDSVLKYLLYWAQKGPKGDLELSHGPATQLVGHIYSGGSIFLGSGTASNDWLSLRPSNGTTTIGPPISASAWAVGTTYPIGSVVAVGSLRYQAKDAHVAAVANQPGSGGGQWKAYWEDVTACRMEGVDGIYRLSKQILYGAFNSFPMVSTAPAGFTVDGSYILNAIPFSGELIGNPSKASYKMPDVDNHPGSVFGATYDGTIINPARVRNPLSTVALSGSDNKRIINVVNDTGFHAVALRGVDEGATPAIGNDSRDTARALDSSTGFSWATGSLASDAPGFNRQLRTRSNGLAERPLSSRFIGRPEEPQRLAYYDLDGDTTTDEHEYAQPEFISAAGTTTDLTQRLQTTSMLANGLESVESPGTYLQAALGGSLYLARRTDYRGWKVVDRSGELANAEPESGMGLVIRERQRPESAYFTPSTLPGPSDPLYMPFAYGHVRASVWPMLGCDIAAQMTDTAGTNISTWTNGFYTTTVAGLLTSSATQRYALGGAVSFRSGTQPGPNYAAGSPDSGSAYTRHDYYTRDSWRFIAMGRPTATTSNGLDATIWNDRPGTTWLAPMGGRPVHSFVASNINVSWTGAPTGSVGVGSDYFSVRWRGFIKPQLTDNFTFYVNRTSGDCGVRVWIDDVMVIDSWSNSGSEVASQARPLAADQLYPIIVEAYDVTGNFGPRLDWSAPSLARETIPNGRLFTQSMPDGFDWSTFTAVETRIDSMNIDDGKAGLMLRASSGISPVMDGREPYVALAYTKNRGVYVQMRGERSRTASGSAAGFFIGNANFDSDANGSFETAMTDADGLTTEQPNAATVQRTATLTPVLNSMTYAPTPGTQRLYTVYTPGNTNPTMAAPAGATSPAGAWPANSGESALSSQADWIGSYNGSYTVWTAPTRSPLGRTVDKPFSVPEGDVDRVWVGNSEMRAQRWPQERSQARLDANFRFYLGGTSAANNATQRFRWIPGDAWPASWPTYDGNIDDIDGSATVKRLFLFSDATGNRTVNGTYTGGNSIFSLGVWSNNWNGGNADIDTAGTVDRGSILYKTVGGGTTDTGYTYWFLDGDANGRPDGTVTTWDKTTPARDSKCIYYVNTGGVDTRPKVFNGSTLVRVLSQAETISLMDATYGSGHYAVNALPAYPAFDAPAPSYAAGDPALVDPTVAGASMGYTRLTAAITAASTVLTVNSGINNGTRGYSIGDILVLTNAAAIEYVRVTAFTDPGSVTVVRAQRGTAASAFAANTLVTQMPMAVSALGEAVLAGTAGTADSWDVRAVGPILVNDVLQIDGEQVRVTGVTARVGTTSAFITVTRGVNGTPAQAHVLNAPIATPLPMLGTLSLAHTNTVTTLTMASTARLAVDDILQVGSELMRVTAIPTATTATVVRGYAASTAVAQALNVPVFRTLGKTFAISRSRTVTFDVNPWISAGVAPTADWRSQAASQADTDDWGYTRANDWGWYWSGVRSYAPWKGIWTTLLPVFSTIAPVPVTGGIMPRAFLNTWLQPLLGNAPGVDTPTTPDGNPPPNVIYTGTTTRYTDDQPATWTDGYAYQAGDVTFRDRVLYRALTGHTANTATNRPGSGANWTLAWEQVPLWLRIERIPSTTRVRMLYALGTDRPTAPAQWRPVMTIPNVTVTTEAGRVSAAAGDARELQIDLASWFKRGRATVSTAMTTGTNVLSITAPTSGSFAIGDVVQVENERMLITGGAGTAFTVVRNWGQDQATTPTHAVGVEVVQARYRGDDLLVGMCAQSTSSGVLVEVNASNLRIETSNTALGKDVIDFNDWEAGSGSGTGANDLTRYLCSQYQVFWGPYDITEDFFYYGQDGTVPRCANEDWIYNNRFFWSQSRWWEDGQEKDPAFLYPNNANVYSMRELYAKTTILSLNMRAMQDYLRNRTLSQAIADRVAGAGPATQTMFGGDYLLRQRVNQDGFLIHASRTNRYPWNPNIKGHNPWLPGYPLGAASNAGGSAALPNSTGSGYTNEELAALPAASRQSAFALIQPVMNTINAGNSLTSTLFGDLVPYTLGAGSTPGQLWRTPAIKPQDFHHAVRITDASDIDWSYGTTDDYQSGGLSVFTPNALYIQGDVNTVPHDVSFGGVPATKCNKVGIFCDTAIMLSKAWNDLNFRNPGLTMNTTTRLVTGPYPSTLAINQGGGNVLPAAQSTRYAFALLTHTLPTTKATVRMGEASSFISTMQYLEDWSSSTMTFVGSIVAMDSRRYSTAYLLDAQKRHGQTPFGWMTAGGNPDIPTAWISEYSPAGALRPANTANWNQLNNGTTLNVNNCWGGTVQGVYGAPTRNFYYNPDFYYKPGQPPLMPFGTSATGLGGWSKIIR